MCQYAGFEALNMVRTLCISAIAVKCTDLSIGVKIEHSKSCQKLTEAIRKKQSQPYVLVAVCVIYILLLILIVVLNSLYNKSLSINCKGIAQCNTM